jgi:hypothetical protein
MFDFFLLSIVNASISFAVADSYLFKPIREYIKNPWFNKLFSCGYCIGHWIALILVLIYEPIIFHSGCLILDYIFTTFALAWISAIQWIIMNILFDKAGK